MILDPQSALCLLCLALIPMQGGSSVRAQTSITGPHDHPGIAPNPVGRPEWPGECHEVSVLASAPTKDDVLVRHEGNVIVMDVHHVTGIGGARLNPPVSGWPAVVVVRLHGFPDLESFSASIPAGALACELTRPPGIEPRLECRLGDAGVQAFRRIEGYFEVTLPPELLANGSIPVEVRWIDQWR